MENYLKINDLITFNYLNTELVKINDDFLNARGPFEKITDQTDISKLDSKGLKVRIAATHAGVITRNNMFYLPDKMQKAAPTFLEDYGKPVLKHHDERQDSIGRVIDSIYIDTSGVIKDSFSSLFDNSKFFTEASLRDFCDGRMPFGLQVDFVRNHFLKDNVLENDSYIGLGHVQIIADITDSDAIQKFLDGRFLTGSVGARTDKAICSICKQDYTKEGSCEHSPGAIYDGQKCVLIAGNFFYDEYSVVNNPADRQSRVLELYYNGNVKNIEVKNEFSGNVYEIRLDFPQYEVKEERMTVEAEKDIKKIEDNVHQEEQKVKQVIEDNVCDAKTLEQLLDILGSEVSISDEDRFYLYDMVYSDDIKSDKEPDWEKLALEMEDYAKSLSDIEDIELEDKQKPQDKPGGSNVGKYKTGPFCGPSGGAPSGSYPVNTLKRAKAALAYARNAPNPAGIRKCVCRHWGKQLPSCQSSKDYFNVPKSSFCGPQKTFPVTKPEDVKAIYKAFDKLKNREDVKIILKNVDRKAKAFGFVKKTKDAISHARVLQMLTQTLSEHMYEKKYREADGKEPVLSDDDVKALTVVMKNLVGMVGKDNFVTVLSGDTKELKDVVKHFQDVDLLEEIISLEGKMGELRDGMVEIQSERDALKEEYDILQKENDSIRDELIGEKQKVRDSRISRMSILTSLKDGEVKDEQKKEWSEFSDEVLETSLDKLEKEIDIKKLSDKLNDGTSRIPSGEVKDPTLSFEDVTVDMKEKINEIEDKAFRNFSDRRQAEIWKRAQIDRLLKKEKNR